MKKIILIAAFAMLSISCNQTKIGYVDVEEILKEYKGTKNAEKEINKKSDELKNELDQLAANYQTKVNDYYAKLKKMSASARQETEKVLMQEQNILKQKQQQAQINVQKEGQEKMQEINEDIKDFVKEYAKKNGYSYVLGTSEQTKSVLYGDSKSDLTDVILEALNDSYKNGTSQIDLANKDTVK